MRFVTFLAGARTAPGLMLDDETILDLEAAFAEGGRSGRVAVPAGLPLPLTLQALIAAGPAVVAACRSCRGEARAGGLGQAIVRRTSATLLAPIPRPFKNVFCVGRNYVDHVAEGYRSRGQELKLPEHPQFFTKPRTAVTGPDAPVPHHVGVTEKLDYEVELGIVIGAAGRDIPRERALDHVFGYTIVNDVTARDLQRRHDQWFKGKGLDGSCPMGPWIVHASALADPQRLDISLTVNGEVRQHANTRDMIFDLPTIIATLSAGLTLEPGDIIATGTPSGVGYAMDPPRFLADGDVVECRIERIGTLRNRIAATRPAA
jgi:2-keto-4-pentenoate hydratase/2-oxohepta-3-ene-1,7-dioic acid hydratase in catechol pathway